jgi:molybdopterin-binding protein
MKLSARNQIAGTIKAAKPGATTTQLPIDVFPSVTITASITNGARRM